MPWLSDLMNAIQQPERFGTRWATNIATGFLPNLIRQPIKLTLTDEQYQEFVTRAGQTARTALGDRFSHRDLTERDIAIIKDIISRSQSLHREIAFRRATP